MEANDTNVAGDELRSFIERVERLEEEKKDIAGDIKEVYGEAKSRGYDVKVLRKIVSLRKQDANERQQQEEMLDLYCQALGMDGQMRLPLEGETVASAAPTMSIQLYGEDGSPLHPPVSTEVMKAAVDVVEARKIKQAAKKQRAA